MTDDEDEFDKVFLAAADDDAELLTDDGQPSYSDKGRILFRFYPIPPGLGDGVYLHAEIDVLDYDAESSVIWLQEGMGIDYFIGCELDLELEGVYVIEGVHGQYYRGDYWHGEDDDEEWYFDSVRRASDEEIAAESLADRPVA